MKALILAAGRGTRVRPLTDHLPKPMIPIVNKPVMAFLVEHLCLHGFNQIMVNTSYLSPQIESYFRDGHQFGAEMAYSFEGRLENGELVDEPLGSAGAIRKIHNHSGFFNETFVVICGDAVIDLDFGELLEFHRSSNAIATIALREVDESEVHNYGVVVMDGDGLITEFQEKPAREVAKSRVVNTGIYIFEPEILDWIPQDGPFDIGGQLFPLLAESGQAMYGLNMNKPWQWLDIGRVPDFHQVTMKAINREIAGFNLPGREISKGVWVGLNVKINPEQCNIVGPVYIGGSSEVQDGATLIGPLMVGSGTLIESGSHLENSVVIDHTRITGNAFFRNKIVSGEYCVDVDGTVLDGRHTDTEWLFADSRSLPQLLSEDQLSIMQAVNQQGEILG